MLAHGRAATETSFPRRYAKIAFFALLGVMTLFVFYKDEGFILHPHSSDWNRFYTFRWLLVPHAFAGLIALVLGPTQFSTRLRRRNLRLHRILGRLYVGAVVVAAPFAFAIGIYHEPLVLMFPTCTQSLLWAVTTCAAFVNARSRRITQHWQWMVRSYCVTFIFVTSRLVQAIPALAGMSRATFAAILFMLQLLAVLGPDLVFNWQDVFTARRATGKDSLGHV
jgi:uncharacterized membrane protein